MASIRKRNAVDGSQRYLVRFRDTQGRQRERSFKRRKDADKFLSTTEADQIRGTWIDPAKGLLTFGDWWEQYWKTTVNLRPSSRARDESYVRNHVLPAFGDVPLATIDHAGVTVWVAELSAKGLAPATVQKAQQILSKSLGSAVDSGRIHSNPCDRVKLPKVEHHEMLFITPPQVSNLASEIDQRYAAFVILGAYGGLRFGELAGLRKDRVDLLRRRVEVAEIVTEVRGHHHTGPPKTRAGRRSVPLPKVAVHALEHQLGAAPGDLVFPAPAGGYLRGSLFRRRIWQPAVVASGLGEFAELVPGKRYRKFTGLRIHDLRHTAVAFWIAAGASPKEIAARAGHSSVVTVLDRYGHLLPGHEDDVNERLDAMASDAITPVIGTACGMDVGWSDSKVVSLRPENQ